MLDNLLNSVRRGAGRVQRRGEEVAQTTRLRLEVFQLTRELDALYARLGRSYHGGADIAVLQEVRGDIRRVDDEISARERLIQELSRDDAGEEPETVPADPGAGTLVLRADPRPEGAVDLADLYTQDPAPLTEPTIPDAMPRPDQAPPSTAPHQKDLDPAERTRPVVRPPGPLDL